MKTRLNAFTLIELLAVVLVIALLAAMTLGAAKYMATRANISRTRGELETLALGLEAFKSDHGYYPTSTVYRLSTLGYKSKENSYMLWQAIKNYVKLKPSQLRYDAAVFTNVGVGVQDVTYIIDSWGNPIVFYNPSPHISSETAISINTDLTVSNTVNLSETDYVTTGGKINQVTFDLFSYGPDGVTYVPGSPATLNGASNPYSFQSAAGDDIWGGGK